MKRLWIELQRWSNQRVAYCHECPPPYHKTKRMRGPSAWYWVNQHAADSGHRVSVRRG